MLIMCVIQSCLLQQHCNLVQGNAMGQCFGHKAHNVVLIKIVQKPVCGHYNDVTWLRLECTQGAVVGESCIVWARLGAELEWEVEGELLHLRAVHTYIPAYHNEATVAEVGHLIRSKSVVVYCLIQPSKGDAGGCHKG